MQTLALEILMLWEDVREQRHQRHQFKLGLLGQDPEQVKAMFESEFATTVNTDEATDDEIDRLIEQEMEGASSEWVTTGAAPSEEEVTDLLRRLSSGQGTMQDLDDKTEWT